MRLLCMVDSFGTYVSESFVKKHNGTSKDRLSDDDKVIVRCSAAATSLLPLL